MKLTTEQVDAPAIHPGHGCLGVERVAGCSAVTTSWACNPVKLLVPRPQGESVWAYVSSFGGGLVAGDETRLTVKLADGCRCFLGTQASTKVYRNPQSRPCGQRLTAELGADSLFVYAPDVVQAFAGSSYVQRQQFHLQPGAGLVLVDWFSSGRAARGERWAFRRYQSRNEIFVNGERLLVDSVLLDAAMGSSHRVGRFNCMALVALVGGPVREAAGRVLEEVAGQPVSQRNSLLRSASPIQGGTLLRIAGERVEEVGREIRARLGFLADLLGDDPWARKW